jgi:hypothetical protein
MKPIQTDYVEKFKEMYLADCAFWLPVNLVNFFFIQNKYRVLFVSCATSAWAILLPLICRDGHHSSKSDNHKSGSGGII